MNQRRRLQSLSRLLLNQLLGRQLVQLVIDQGQQLLGGLEVALLDGDQDVDCDVIVCSDDDRARQVASELSFKIPGVRAIDGGKLENARIVESITALLITLNIRHKVHSAGLRITGLGI